MKTISLAVIVPLCLVSFYGCDDHYQEIKILSAQVERLEQSCGPKVSERFNQLENKIDTFAEERERKHTFLQNEIDALKKSTDSLENRYKDINQVLSCWDTCELIHSKPVGGYLGCTAKCPEVTNSWEEWMKTP